MQPKRVICPHCGYIMPITIDVNAKCKGLNIQCKGRKCRKLFEIKIEKGEQIK